MQKFFGQLNRILLLVLPSSQRLNLDEPTMVIIALIREVKATLRNGIYYYRNFGGDEVVDLSTLQCVVGRIWDREEWAIIDQSNNLIDRKSTRLNSSHALTSRMPSSA